MKIFAEIVPDKTSIKKMKREVEATKPKITTKTDVTAPAIPTTPTQTLAQEQSPAPKSGAGAGVGVGVMLMPMMKMLAPLVVIASVLGIIAKTLMDLEPIKAIMEMINNILKIALLPVALMLMRLLMPVLLMLMKAMRQGFWKSLGEWLFGGLDTDFNWFDAFLLILFPPGFKVSTLLTDKLFEWIFGYSTLDLLNRFLTWIFGDEETPNILMRFWNWLTGGDEPNLFGRFWIWLTGGEDAPNIFVRFWRWLVGDGDNPNLFSKLWTWLVGDEETESVWSRFTTWLSNAWNEFLEDLKKYLKQLPTKMWDDFTSAISSGASALRGLASWIASWVRSQIRRAREGAGELVGRVGKAIGVTDFVVTPAGILKTHPNDYLIGTKNPQGLGGGRDVTINIKVDGVATDKIVDDIERKLSRVVRNMDVIF